ncbi:YggS family pyridoxal phosphate-dependent enzyme [Desulfurobacterium thermolithotrophum]|uniref:YggS family pyridoxal phosphate-dependent enzyme n=1 Tax=Desulfurobacterium thermolithotrophum TaxID=64160 RepID=UPI0013D79232|nr:YggS family pyridoxal phosphate-dependent enzyme [Desulfurobacterium thermolithotrophum]
MEIRENVKRIKERIEKACERAKRSPDEVFILAASKTRAPEEIRKAFEAGIKLFGENRVQEAREKIPLLSDLPIEWHMIGHLQKNKVKYAVNLFEVIESVGSKELADELEKRLSKIGKKLEVFIEVKLSPEETKHGCSPNEVEELARYVLELKHLDLKGLMTVPPYFEDVELVRPYFRRLREIRDRLEDSLGMKIPHLSMGMSHDFEVAVEEGATIVRIGTAIFGPRNY